MKRIVKKGIVCVCAVILTLAVIMVSNIGGGEIADGIYRIENCAEYPVAYAQVEGNTIQFYNIDLNELYREKQREEFQWWIEQGVGATMTEEQIDAASDLNELFVNNAWEIDYELADENKQGTFTYVYFCIVKDTRFGLVLQYDALNKTIQINDPKKTLLFKK